jgi:hypothetical protein
MKEWLQLDKVQQLRIFEQIRLKTGLPVQAIEKDWWVVQTLQRVFSCSVAAHTVFKGGTSLSKAWNLIDRFSEDIDLALDRKILGFDKAMTGAQVSRLRKQSFHYISEKFYPELKAKFKQAGFDQVTVQLAEIRDTDQDPLIIEVYYPGITNSSAYIQPRVLVEIGSRSLMEPYTPKSFSSLVGELYKGEPFADAPIMVPTVNPERTFLEKIFLLHEEFQKTGDKIRVDRLSRHLYDIEKMMDTPFAAEALANKDLYKSIVEHRRTVTPLRGIDYSNHTPDKINPVPTEKIITAWQKDYETMQEFMIYKESL